ncbi:MAG: TMEM165/GDT1 family protein [Cyanobacteria bacterium J06659_2]
MTFPAQEGVPSISASSSSESSMTVHSSTDDTSAIADLTANSGANPEHSPFWGIFFSTFVTIFLAEIGDKTQLTTLLMTAESHAPWIVFAGAGSALVLTSLLGVLLGQWLATRIEPKTLDRAAGLTLLGIAVWLLWDVWQG